ncbi:MAG: hypothetical protein U0T69_14030 [Chitinophagales bacterium]
MKTIFSTLLLLAISLSLVAQTPQGINYQTVVRNVSGAVLANTNVGVKINIRSGSASGTIVYAESHAVTTNQFGLVNFIIGQGTVISGTFANINWGNGTYFAETLVDPAGGTSYVTVGTQQLMSVPYALYAAASHRSDTSAYSASSGDTTMWLKNGNKIYYNKGYVGISTNNPLNQLHVIGNIRAGVETDSNYILMGGIDAGFVIQRKADLAYIDFTTDRFNAGGARIQLIENGLRFGTGVTTNLERMRILSNGNVGIGSSNPKSKLTVTGGDVNITDIASGIIMKSPNGNCWRVTIDNSGNLVRTAITCP